MPYLSIVEEKLGVKEDMIENESLVTFLNKKRKSGTLQDQISILGVFDCILENIEEMYKRKLEKRDDGLDEFDVENVAAGRRLQNGLFYQNYFLPSSLFLIYQSWLKTDLEGEVMMNDLFTIGAGSATFALFPEVTGICYKCAAEKFASLENKTSEDIRLINIKVFKEQKRNKFVLPASNKVTSANDSSDSDSDESRNIDCNPFLSDDGDFNNSVEYPSQDIANPFETSENESDEEELFLDACDICSESFPSDDFVQLHKTIFHHRVLKTKFVEKPESLMTTFIQPPTMSPLLDGCESEATGSAAGRTADKSDIAVVAANDSSSNSGDAEKKFKYNFRKRLKY